MVQPELFPDDYRGTSLAAKMIGTNWSDKLSSDTLRRTDYILSELRKLCDIRPQPQDIFAVFKATKPEDVKVVIMGQDPYYSKNNANGFAFACKNTVAPSLEQIIHAVQINYGLLHTPKIDRTLSTWIGQGVFLLNRSLSVTDGEPNSHSHLNWHLLTDEVVEVINRENRLIVWMLWGKEAQEVEKYITNQNHVILKAEHPAAASYRKEWWKCNHFYEANRLLNEYCIQWY